METSTHVVYQKTGKGVDELKTRRHGLGPRLRQLLILVDGKREVAELARMMPAGELAEQLAQLESGGFVALPHEGASPEPGEAPAHGGSPAPPQDAPAQLAPAGEDLRVLRARVTRALLDTIGPNGDDFAIRLERARSVEELRALLPAVLSVVEACGGRVGVDGFLQRCGAI